MRYTYKERVIMAKKLKIFLAIFFAAITFFTGKVILDKTFAADVVKSGTIRNVSYKIMSDNELIIGEAGQTQTFRTVSAREWDDWYDQVGWYAWNNYRENITKVTFAGPVIGTTIMSRMFYKFYKLTTFENLDWFDVSQVTNMSGMFEECYSLESLDLSSFYTSNATNMNSMFYKNYKLVELNIINFDTVNASMSSWFYGCYALKTLHLGQNFVFKSGTYFSGKWMKDGGSVIYTADELIANYNGPTMYGKYVVPKLYAMLYSSGKMIFQRGNSVDSTYGTLLASYTDFEDQHLSEQTIPWYSRRSSVTEVDFIDTVMPKSLAYWFNGMSNLSIINNISKIQAFNVTNMSYMFRWCSSLTEIDLSSFNTYSLTSFNGMFQEATNIKRINLSSFNTSNVTQMYRLFDSCTNLEEVDITGFSVQNTINQQAMFMSCNSLKTLKLGTNFAFMNDCNLTGNSWRRDGDTTTYTATQLIASYVGSTMAGTYRNTILSTYAILYDSGDLVFQTGETPDSSRGNVVSSYTGFETTNTGSASNAPWISKCENVTRVVFECAVTPISTAYWFYGMRYLTEIQNIDYLNTSNVVDMQYMFALGGYRSPAYDTVLTELDLSEFDTSKVTNMKAMFYGCSNVSNLDVSGFDTSNVTSMYLMFHSCKSITALDLSNFNTSKVTSMYSMFSYCENLLSLDLSSFNTSKVSEMESMFNQCKGLVSLDLSSFDTSSVERMGSMFSSCAALTNLDLSSFDTSNVRRMNSMFSGCYSLTSLDLSGFDTTSVTGDLSWMFSYCTSLVSLDLSGFNTSNITSMNYMFNSCRKLAILKLGTNWNFVSDNDLTGSWKRDGDTVIYTADELKSMYNGSTMAGTYRAVAKLTISEEVRGSLADTNKNFSFTITMMDGIYGLDGTFAYTGSKNGDFYFDDGVATFTLKHGQTIYAYLPYYYDYTITQNSDGYTLTKSNDTGTLNNDKTATFTDTLNGTTPTGIYLDIIPYILMIIFGVGSVLLLRKLKYI